MKISIFDILSAFVILLVGGVGIIVAIIFFKPTSELNLFPPPTVPAAIFVPSPTATFIQMPSTWTPDPNDGFVRPTLKSSSTAISMPGVPLLPSMTPSITLTKTPTVTLTPTRTVTRTITLTLTPTRTRTPNLTATKLSIISTNAKATEIAKTPLTSTVTLTRTITMTPTLTQTPTVTKTPTLTSTSLPANPTSATEDGGTLSNTWQKTINDPLFTWAPAVGATGYYVYWGTSPTGTSANTVSTELYDPGPVSSGTYYLRVRSRFVGADHYEWSTLFVFRYDNTAPVMPSSAVETVQNISSAVWQKDVNNPAFTWNAATDAHVGVVSNYDVYFGTDSGGTTITTTTTNPAYDPPTQSSGTYYLRVRATDSLGNISGWSTLFTFQYDGLAPEDPANIDTVSLADDTQPVFTWDASADTHSGLAVYEIYWGTDGACGEANQLDVTDPTFTAPEITGGAQTYRICVWARDNVDNISAAAEDTFDFSP